MKHPRCRSEMFSLLFGVMSLLSFGVLAAIPAVICGHIALRRINRSTETLSRQGLAIAGLIMGYLGFLITLAILLLRTTGFFRARGLTAMLACIIFLLCFLAAKRPNKYIAEKIGKTLMRGLGPNPIVSLIDLPFVLAGYASRFGIHIKQQHALDRETLVYIGKPWLLMVGAGPLGFLIYCVYMPERAVIDNVGDFWTWPCSVSDMWNIWRVWLLDWGRVTLFVFIIAFFAVPSFMVPFVRHGWTFDRRGQTLTCWSGILIPFYRTTTSFCELDAIVLTTYPYRCFYYSLKLSGEARQIHMGLPLRYHLAREAAETIASFLGIRICDSVGQTKRNLAENAHHSDLKSP